MAKKSKKSSGSDKKSKAPLVTIEKLAEKNKVPGWILAGAKQKYNWGKGKKLTEKDFLKKVDEFKKGPMKQT